MNKDIAFYESYDSLFIAEASMLETSAWNEGWSQLKQECVKSGMEANFKISTAEKNPGGWERSIVCVCYSVNGNCLK